MDFTKENLMLYICVVASAAWFWAGIRVAFGA